MIEIDITNLQSLPVIMVISITHLCVKYTEHVKKRTGIFDILRLKGFMFQSKIKNITGSPILAF